MATNQKFKTVSASDRIDGPIPEFDKHGDYTGYDYFRCEVCGIEAMREADLRDGRCHCGGKR